MNGKAVHLLSAYATKARLVLMQAGVDGKSNEIKAISELLSCLDLTGAVVTIDAIGCQKTIAEQIIQAKADTVLALKNDHPQLCDDVRLRLDTEADKGSLEVHETVDKDHGRLEIRRYSLSRDIAWLLQKPGWRGLQAVGRVESIRLIGDKTTTERRYYLTSLTGLSRFAETVRGQHAILFAGRQLPAFGNGGQGRGCRQTRIVQFPLFLRHRNIQRYFASIGQLIAVMLQHDRTDFSPKLR